MRRLFISTTCLALLAGCSASAENESATSGPDGGVIEPGADAAADGASSETGLDGGEDAPDDAADAQPDGGGFLEMRPGSRFCEPAQPDAPIMLGTGRLATRPPQGAETPPKEIWITDNLKGAIPTNDWWSSALVEPFSRPMFAHPLAVKAEPGGLGIGYPNPAASANHIVGGYHRDLTVGLQQVSFADARVDDFSDWTVTLAWSDGARGMRATVGHGLPFAYFRFEGAAASITMDQNPQVWLESGSTLGLTVNGNHYAIFGSAGSTWGGLGTTTLINPSGGGYLSVAVLPSADAGVLQYFKTYSASFVTGTRAEWRYDELSSEVITDYAVTAEPMEGTETGTLLALYPHQWKSTAAALTPHSYRSARGPMKVVAGKSFTTRHTFNGILPMMPGLGDADPQRLAGYLEALRDEAVNHPPTAKDTYWKGKALGRMAMAVPIAQQAGKDDVAEALLAWLRGALELPLTSVDATGSPTGDQAFYYEPRWKTVIGYPSSFGSATELNDHHFHYGYWIRAAAEMARNDPDWAADGRLGAVMDVLVEDIAGWDRTSPCLPYLRNFDPYAGHSWASGTVPFDDGNNNESSSEAMNAWAAVALWGALRGDRTVRDLGIYLYTTEAQAVEQYWFDVDNDTFAPGYSHNYASMIWGAKTVYEIWFGPDPGSHPALPKRGINLLPITPASLYLGRKPQIVTSFLAELAQEIGSDTWTQWPDIFWAYEALANPAKALERFDANAGYQPEAGESKAHTYAWIHALRELGQVDASVTADSPLATVFRNASQVTHVAYNPSASPMTVHFSDGASVVVAPGSMGRD